MFAFDFETMFKPYSSCTFMGSHVGNQTTDEFAFFRDGLVISTHVPPSPMPRWKCFASSGQTIYLFEQIYVITTVITVHGQFKSTRVPIIIIIIIIIKSRAWLLHTFVCYQWYSGHHVVLDMLFVCVHLLQLNFGYWTLLRWRTSWTNKPASWQLSSIQHWLQTVTFYFRNPQNLSFW